eukprot:scaffold7722_cov97-Skeletonema_marinoi.AAC.2
MDMCISHTTASRCPDKAILDGRKHLIYHDIVSSAPCCNLVDDLIRQVHIQPTYQNMSSAANMSIHRLQRLMLFVAVSAMPQLPR